MDTCIGYDDKLERLQSLSIGKVRELLAYADGDERLDDWLDDIVPALLDEDEDYEAEDGEAELANPEEEQLAQDIAGDIYWHKYSLEDIPKGMYSPEIMDRIRYLI